VRRILFESSLKTASLLQREMTSLARLTVPSEVGTEFMNFKHAV